MDEPGIRPTVDIRRDTKQCPVCAHRFARDAGFCPFDGAALEAASYDPLGDPLVGTTVDGRYEVQALLGEGGMGQVYRVRHTSLDRMFAMKVLRRELACDDELSERFIQEARATASVRHPNVVQITDFGRMPTGVPYFVMEHLAGQSLADVVHSGGPVPVGGAVRIVRQIAAALGAAHEAGIVHRDLKPDNVFLVGGVSGGVVSGDVRVVDFGAAKVIGSSRVTRQGVVFGTPAYMSPEQASGQPVDRRADVYALGIILYEMLAGRVPFEADTYMGVLTQHMFVQPVPPSQVAPAGREAGRELGALEEITLICLAKKPEERFATMHDLASALDTVVRLREDGSVEVAPHLDRRQSRAPASIRFRMADELEPPTLEEMVGRGAAAHSTVRRGSWLPPRRVVPWGWLVGVAAALLCGIVTWTLVRAGARSGPAAGPVPEAPGGLPAHVLPSAALPSLAPSPASSPTEADNPQGMAPAPTPVAPHVPPRRSPSVGTAKVGRGAAANSTVGRGAAANSTVGREAAANSTVGREAAANTTGDKAAGAKQTNLDDIGDPFAAKR